MQPRIFLHDNIEKTWLDFRDPLAVIQAARVEEVIPALQELEAAVEQERLWAAGFISYEASPAFEPALSTHPTGDLPLLWFGLFQEPVGAPLPLPAQGEPIKLPAWRASQPPQEYSQSIACIKDHITRGNTYQVNYTMRLYNRIRVDPWAYFLQLAQAQQSSYGAFVDTGRDVICSASPELFFQLEGEQLCSKPMKGTATRGRSLEEDRAQIDWLQHSEKDRAENLMIVDMIRNDMGRVAELGSVQVPRLFEVERYPTVLQMTSTVTCRTRASLTDILRGLFPCASITGAPKVRTMQIIRDLESGPRGIYTGTIGYLAPGRRAQFNVAIRTVAIERGSGRAEYGVGSGIVWDSHAQGEYEECRTKSRVLTQPRPHFDLLETMLWRPGRGIYLLERHLERLSSSAEYFGYPLDLCAARRQLEGAVAHSPPQPQRIRLLLSPQGSLQTEISPFEPGEQPSRLRAGLARQAADSNDIFLYHKTTRRQVYEQARSALPGLQDALLWNERGQVTEFTIANAVVSLDGRLLTPPVDCGLLAGTLRAELLAAGRISEGIIPVEELARAEAIWAINSVRGWQLVDLIAA